MTTKMNFHIFKGGYLGPEQNKPVLNVAPEAVEPLYPAGVDVDKPLPTEEELKKQREFDESNQGNFIAPLMPNI
jgi:hypothetical protein